MKKDKKLVLPLVRDIKALSAERLFLCALLPLYTDDVLDSYLKSHYNADSAILDLVRRIPESTSLRAQQAISLLAPKALKLNLYIAAYNRLTPTHCCTITRESISAPWKLKNHHLRIIDAEPARDGVLAYFTPFSPDPKVNAAKPIQFQRVYRGGAAHLHAEVESDSELQRMLTFCLLTLSPSKRAHLYTRPLGKATFTFSSSDDPYSEPFNFSPHSFRRDASPTKHNPGIIYADAPSEAFQDHRAVFPRYFVNHYRDRPEFISDDLMLVGTAKDLLLSGILPFIGINQPQVYSLPNTDASSDNLAATRSCEIDEEKVILVSLGLNLETNEVFLVDLGPAPTGVPSIKRLNARRLVPSFFLLHLLRNIFHVHPSEALSEGLYGHNDRVLEALKAFRSFTDPTRISEYFASAELPLDAKLFKLGVETAKKAVKS